MQINTRLLQMGTNGLGAVVADVVAKHSRPTPSFIIGKTVPDEITSQVIVGDQPIREFDLAISKALSKGAAPVKAEQPKKATLEKPAG